MTFFTSVSPSFIKIFTSHFNLHFLPLQKLNQSAILVSFAPEPIDSSQYSTTIHKGYRQDGVGVKGGRVNRRLSRETSNFSQNRIFDFPLSKNKKDLSRDFIFDEANEKKIIRPSYTSINQSAFAVRKLRFRRLKLSFCSNFSNRLASPQILRNQSTGVDHSSNQCPIRGECFAPASSGDTPPEEAGASTQSSSLALILFFWGKQKKIVGAQIFINEWVKKELHTRFKSNLSTITQTLPKKDQRAIRNLVISQDKLNPNNMTFGKDKYLSNSSSFLNFPTVHITNAHIKGDKELPPFRRLGPVSQITKKNRVLNNVNILLQPYYSCTDYYSSTSFHGTSTVMICSYDKYYLQLKLTDNGYWGFIPKRTFKIIRPLLNCSRNSITRVCKHIQIPVYPDKSNESVQYSRNRIRKQLLPIIKLFFNPQVEDSLFKFAELITKEQNLLATLFNSK